MEGRSRPLEVYAAATTGPCALPVSKSCPYTAERRSAYVDRYGREPLHRDHQRVREARAAHPVAILQSSNAVVVANDVNADGQREILEVFRCSGPTTAARLREPSTMTPNLPACSCGVSRTPELVRKAHYTRELVDRGKPPRRKRSGPRPLGGFRRWTGDSKPINLGRRCSNRGSTMSP